ncbi:OFA family MFS transporter [Nocardioides sp. CFH 31398]|uniref:OFA family MFS transporter n=1 Tax=Nocardioides sp. CFH 31398 TaxID=2919579 RepID=UPI001F06FBB1|nr:OFA family MFS transporter [Nocardioides sp. CFH 31398]MCH1866408.1 OFA family MFS transporter [Nocardioides sp. CFH 31398]
MLPGFLRRERIVAGPGFNRWLIPPAALAVHLSIGQVYATSVYRSTLQEEFAASETAIGFIFSIAIVMLGLSSFAMGTWVDRNGPRAAMALSMVFWVSGFLVGALGIASAQLWLVYLGYGVLGGIGLGIGYISPVSTLIKWFPDRPGLATGMAIMGFGGGALVASPLSGRLLSLYDGDFDPSSADSVASSGALVSLFLTLAVVYAIFMSFGAFIVRVPADDWKPAGFDPEQARKSDMISTASVTASNALKTPQFWLLWVVLFCNVTAGIGILEQASGLIQDAFSSVTPAAAAGFVGLLSIANMAGRFVWSTTSDKIGRKPTYMLYLGGGAILYALFATVGSSSIVVFLLLAVLMLSFYGGGFATIPAYLRDLFGTLQVGAIHGRLLTAWSAAGVAGPLILNGILDLTGAVTIALFVMVGLLAVGFLANLMVKPVDSKWHEPETDPALKGSNA